MPLKRFSFLFSGLKLFIYQCLLVILFCGKKGFPQKKVALVLCCHIKINILFNLLCVWIKLFCVWSFSPLLAVGFKCVCFYVGIIPLTEMNVFGFPRQQRTAHHLQGWLPERHGGLQMHGQEPGRHIRWRQLALRHRRQGEDCGQ